MTTFTEMGLKPELLKAIEDLNFEFPTPIQEKIIPELLKTDNDITGIAQTGTGKTAAFGLPILQKIEDTKIIQALVLSPTRELAVQISKDFKSFSKYLNKISVVPVYGGTNIEMQIKDLKKGAHIVVGTPGRVLDLIKRKVLKVNNIKTLVLDEADEMLNMGFKEELSQILENIPPLRQTLLFSATMPDEISKIAENYMNSPVRISVSQENIAAKNVEHLFYLGNAKDKYLVLKRIADFNPNIYGIIFCRTRRETKEIAEKLIKDGYDADALHGDLSQAQRDTVMMKFRLQRLQMLVATDVAARGLDIDNLTHVINFSLPDELEVYIHRSGRTGRAGKSGKSISIIHSREKRRLDQISKIIGKKFKQYQIPTGEQICEKQLYHMIDKMEKVEIDEKQIEQYLPSIYKKLDWLSKEDLIKRFVSVEFNRFLDYYRNSEDLNIVYKETLKAKSNAIKGKKISFSRMFINVGKKDKLSPKDLISMINSFTKVRGIEIGKIDILRNFSFFEIDKNYENDIVNGFKNKEFSGMKLNVEVANPLPEKKNNKRKRK